MRRVDADVLVVGGGPAGLGAAIFAAQTGLEVVIFEPRVGPIDKACGEGLMPGAVALLERMGVARPEGRPFVGIRYSDGSDPGRMAEGTFPGGAQGLGTRRLVLHESLAARAQALGVRFVFEKADRVEQDERGVEAAGLRGRYLIAADGLHSPIRRKLGLGLPPRRPRRFGARRHYRMAPWHDRVEVQWAGRSEAYITPVAPDQVGVAILFEPPGRYDRMLPARFPHLAERLAGAEPTSELQGAGPFEQRLRRRSMGRVLLVGDAAGYLDPLTGEGVALGLLTAQAAVACIRQERPQDYEALWRRRTRRYFLLTGGLLRVAASPHLRPAILPSVRHVPGLLDAALAVLAGERDESARTLGRARARGRGER